MASSHDSHVAQVFAWFSELSVPGPSATQHLQTPALRKPKAETPNPIGPASTNAQIRSMPVVRPWLRAKVEERLSVLTCHDAGLVTLRCG